MIDRRHALTALIALLTLAASSAQAQTADIAPAQPAAPSPTPQVQAPYVQAPYAQQYAQPPNGQYAPYAQAPYAQDAHAQYAQLAQLQYAYANRRHRPIVGYRDDTRNPPAIWGTGLALFLAGWVLDFAILTPIANAISLDRPGASEQDAWAWSLVPIAGPFIQLGIEAPHPAIPIITGLLQIGGLVTFIVGLTTQETNHVPIYQGDPDDPNMVRVAIDGGPIENGAQISVNVQHL